MLEDLDQLESSGLAAIQRAGDPAALERWRIEYLGTKGRLKAMMPRMKAVSAADKPAVGRRLNEVKSALESAFARKKAAGHRE